MERKSGEINRQDNRIWNRFRKNPFSLAGLIYISVVLCISVCGYLVIPDSSPMANTMHIQLSIRPPGSTFSFFLLPKSEALAPVSIAQKMLFGQTSTFDEMPISSYRFKQDSLIVTEYTGVKGDTLESRGYHLARAAFAVVGPVKKDGTHYSFADRSGKKFNLSAAELKHIVNQRLVHRTYCLGTDLYGRDLLSRLILGSRVSLSVGLVSVIISLLLGVLLGSLAGYYGGVVDSLISWLINVVWSLPSLLLVISISFALGKGFWQIFIAVGLTMWVEVARMVRGQFFMLRATQYVEAGKALGFSDGRIIFRHILPNIVGPILVVASSNFASAILLEAGLSFLGYGAQPPFPTWGSMIKENYGYIIIDAAFLALIPGIAIMTVVYGFNLIAIGLGDAYNVKTRYD